MRAAAPLSPHQSPPLRLQRRAQPSLPLLATRLAATAERARPASLVLLRPARPAAAFPPTAVLKVRKAAILLLHRQPRQARLLLLLLATRLAHPPRRTRQSRALLLLLAHQARRVVTPHLRLQLRPAQSLLLPAILRGRLPSRAFRLSAPLLLLARQARRVAARTLQVFLATTPGPLPPRTHLSRALRHHLW